MKKEIDFGFEKFPQKKKRKKLKTLFIIMLLFAGCAYAVNYFSEKWEEQQAAYKPDAAVKYCWQNENGTLQYTDYPPEGIKSVKVRKACEYVEPPWYVKIKDTAAEWMDDTRRTFNISVGNAQRSVRNTQKDIRKSVSDVREGVKEVQTEVSNVMFPVLALDEKEKK